MVFATWNCILIPIQVAFKPAWASEDYMFLVNALIDLVFLLDIFVNLRTTYLDYTTGEEVSNPKRICFKYIRLRFWIDLVTTVPFDTFFEIFLFDFD